MPVAAEPKSASVQPTRGGAHVGVMPLHLVGTTEEEAHLAPGLAEEITTLDEMVDRAVAYAQREGFAELGDRVVITGGVPLGVTGATNMLRVAVVGAK